MRRWIAVRSRGCGAPVLGGLAGKELTGGEAPEAFNFFVDRAQQFLKNDIEVLV